MKRAIKSAVTYICTARIKKRGVMSQARVAKKKLLSVPQAALNQRVSQPIVAFKVDRLNERISRVSQSRPIEMDRRRRPEPTFAGEDAHRHEHGHQLDEPDEDMAGIALAARAVKGVADDEREQVNPGDRHQGPRPTAIAFTSVRSSSSRRTSFQAIAAESKPGASRTASCSVNGSNHHVEPRHGSR